MLSVSDSRRSRTGRSGSRGLCQGNSTFRSLSALTALCCMMAVAALPAFASDRSSLVVDGVSLGPSDASRMSTARADANRLLSLAWHPSGARRLSTWIHLKGFELSEPGASIGDPDQSDVPRFYLARSTSQGLSWLNAPTPDGGTLEGSGGTDRANLEWSYSFPFTPVLPQSDLQYTKRILPDGDVELRIDAQVAWTPQKSRFSIVPSGATVVQAVYSTNNGSTQAAIKRSEASTTDATTIATIRRQINALPVAYPGPMSCPFEDPGSITVRFLHSAHAQAFATVHFDSKGCGGVQVSSTRRRITCSESVTTVMVMAQYQASCSSSV